MLFFTAEQLVELRRGHREAHEKLSDITFCLVSHQFENKKASEYARHGLTRRLGTMLRCIDRIYEIIPPDLNIIPERETVLDATINIQAFIFNTFGCCDNIAWVWILEKDKRLQNGNEFLAKRIGLGPEYKELRESLTPRFRDYLNSRSEWFAHIKDFRDA